MSTKKVNPARQALTNAVNRAIENGAPVYVEQAATNPDTVIHVFRTFAGIAPDTSDQPVCGATLTRAYDWPADRTPRPKCAACARILQAHRDAILARAAARIAAERL
jgi:hypothetical protein